MTRVPQLYGIFGGTFDPIHRGHIESIQQVARMTGLSSISVLPAAVPPHRPPTWANAFHRLAMTRLAVHGLAGIEVDDRELQRQSPSYTYDTVLSFIEQRPQDMPCLIVGMDAALGFERWYEWQALLDLCHLIIMRRPGWEPNEDLPHWWRSRLSDLPLESLTKPAVIQLDIEPNPLSATLIRNKLAAGDNVAPYLPDGVYNYILEQNLYEHNMSNMSQNAVNENKADAINMREIVVNALEDAKAEDIRVLDVRNLTDVTDYMVVATGTSDRHVKSLSNSVLVSMHDAGWQHMGVEGEDIKEWILIDFVDVVIHVMRAHTRAMYDLESLWDETLSEVLRPTDGITAKEAAATLSSMKES